MPNNIKQGPNWVAADPTGAADMQAQQLELQRRQALADALQQKGAEDIQVPAGSRMSWTQGLDKMLSAWVGAKMQRQNMADQWDLGAQQANATAALHDPTGKGIAPVNLANNPFRHHAPLPDPTLPAPTTPAPAQAMPLPAPAQGAAAGAPPAAPPPMPGMKPDGTPIVPSTLNTGTPQGYAQAVRLMQSLPAQPIDAGSVAGAGGADAPAASTPGANPDPSTPQLGPQTQQLLAALLNKRAGLPPVGAPPINPRNAELAAGLKKYGQPQPAPTAQPPIPQPTLAQQHDAISAATGEPTPLHVTNALQAGQRAGQPQGAPMPQGGQQMSQMPQQPQPPTQPGQVMDAMVPTMTARQGYLLAQTQPEAWAHLVEQANTPTDAARALIQAGVLPGTPEFQKGMRAAAAKATQTPLNDDKRGYLTDAYSGEVKAFHPQISNDATPLFDGQGNVVGERTLPGAADVIRTTTGAHALGDAQGRLVQVWDAGTQSMKYVPESVVLAGGANGGYAAGAPMGSSAGADDAAKRSSAGFQADAQVAAGAPQRRFLLNQIGELGRLTSTGAGTPGLIEAKSHMNSVLAQAGFGPWFDNRGIANTQEIQKSAALLAQQQAAAYGGSTGATDAKLQAAFASLPDANKAPQAIQTIVRIMTASEDALQAKGQASAAYFHKYGATPTSYTDFSTQWTKNADPELFQRVAAARTNPAAMVAGLNKQQAAAMVAKYRALKALGAF